MQCSMEEEQENSQQQVQLWEISLMSHVIFSSIAQEESIAEMLEPLNDLDRQIVLMRCEEELSFREIAERLSMKEAAARKRFERARKAIQQKKGELYDEIRTQLFSV